MPRADLHVHTLYSDGTFTPREALTLARDRGLDTVAITDQDTTAGLDEAGGASVLGHPGTFRVAKPVPVGLLAEPAAAGLDGIEASHPEHTPEVEAGYIETAERLGLLWTGSSDCHGERYDPVRLGMR